MNKETLEEFWTRELSNFSDNVRNTQFDLGFRTGTIIGLRFTKEGSYSEEDMKQFAWECVANFLSNSDNKVEMELAEVIMDRNKIQFERFKKK